MNDKDMITLEIPEIELKKIAYYLGRLSSLSYGAEEIYMQLGKDLKDLGEASMPLRKDVKGLSEASGIDDIHEIISHADDIIIKADHIRHKTTVLLEAWKRMAWIAGDDNFGGLMPSYSSPKKIPKEVADLFKLAYDRGYFGMADIADLEAEDLETRLNMEGLY